MSYRHDSAGPNFLHPLQKRTRSEAVTAQLSELSRLSPSAVLRRVSETDPARRLERETLVAAHRGYLRAGQKDAANAVLKALIDRTQGALAGRISSWAGLTPENKADAKQQMIAHLCEQVGDLSAGAELWECRFAFCVQRRLITLWHRLTDRQVATVPAEAPAQGGEDWNRLEQQADPRDTFGDIELRDMVALVSGGDPKRGQAIFLRMSGFSDEEIAAQLGVTSRTLRNWTAAARAAYSRHQAADSKQLKASQSN